MEMTKLRLKTDVQRCLIQEVSQRFGVWGNFYFIWTDIVHIFKDGLRQSGPSLKKQGSQKPRFLVTWVPMPTYSRSISVSDFNVRLE
jgi:hypothetical protein